jgi:HEAT repeat protein
VGTPAAVPAVKEALAREQNGEVKLALVRALTRLGGTSPDALGSLMSSRDPRVREMAVRALAGRGAIDPWPWPEPRPRPFP